MYMTRKQDFEKHADKFDRKKKLAVKTMRCSDSLHIRGITNHDDE